MVELWCIKLDSPVWFRTESHWTIEFGDASWDDFTWQRTSKSLSVRIYKSKLIDVPGIEGAPPRQWRKKEPRFLMKWSGVIFLPPVKDSNIYN